MNRRKFLGSLVGVLGAAAFVPIFVPEELPTDVHEDNYLTDIADEIFPVVHPFHVREVADRMAEKAELEFTKAFFGHKKHHRVVRSRDECLQATIWQCYDCGKRVMVADRAMRNFGEGIKEFDYQTVLAQMGDCTPMTNANPIDDIKEGIKRIREATGVEPNTIIVGKEQYDSIKMAESVGYFFTNVVD